MKFDAFEDYLKLERNYSPHTLKAYLTDLHDFSEYVLKEFEVEEIQNVSYSLIRSWIVHLVDQHISNRSINRKISSLRSYYDFLLKSDQIEVSPLLKHRPLKTSKRLQVPFSEKEMEEALDLAVSEDFESVRDQFIVTLFYATGIRRSELINIQTDDLHPQSRELKIRGKGNKERIIPLLPIVTERLEEYLKYRQQLEIIEDDSYLFLTKKGKKLYDVLVYRMINEYFRKISTKTKMSPHILRHSFATHLLNQGADINSIKTLMGHESLTSTQIYTHNDISFLKKIHGQAHPRNKK